MHRNAPLTPEGRLRLCQRIMVGWTVAAAAESMNISRQCAHKWWRRYQDEGIAGLEDRSSRPRSCPHRTPARLERRIVALRQSRKLGPARLAGIVGVPASTVHRVLVRHGLQGVGQRQGHLWIAPLGERTGQFAGHWAPVRSGGLGAFWSAPRGRVVTEPPGKGARCLSRRQTSRQEADGLTPGGRRP